MYRGYGMSKDEYEEYYGEQVIRCRVNGITAIDSCPACDELEEIFRPKI